MPEKHDTLMDDVLGGVGLAAGSVVGIAAGVVGGAVKLVASGGDLDEAKYTFDNVFEKCLDEGERIGKKHGLGLVSLGLGILFGRPHRGGGSS